MIVEAEAIERSLRTEVLESDFVVVGGGLAGVCAAVTAAREGLKTVLVQDRPVLGGNASSEVRLWALGATSHMGNNNRWSREGGLVNEILEENLYRNRQGNPIIFDTILLEKCFEEENLTVLLNTAAVEVEKNGADSIAGVHAFCSQNSTRYHLKARLFCDASGDGIIGFLAGAAFRMGAESKEEFGELFAPDAAYGELLGHSIYFYSKEIGEPVKYVAPSWALKDIESIPRYREIKTNMQGCNFWWFEYGGRLDTIHQSEEIKLELWRVAYGVWDYIKNSGGFPDAENLTLEWVGHVPGKRESRRFEGDYIIKQQDLIEQRQFDDVIAHGGWALDLHPADGIYSNQPGCTQWHAKGVYGMPLRSFYSRNIDNLFLAGRIVSATHVAFGSTRVMLTCAAGGVGVGASAVECLKGGCNPRDLLEDNRLRKLQQRLDRLGQFLPGVEPQNSHDLAAKATVSASSEFVLDSLPAADLWRCLDFSVAMLLPFRAGKVPMITFSIDASEATEVIVELMRSQKAGNFTPDELIESKRYPLESGIQELPIQFETNLEKEGYCFVKIAENPLVKVQLSTLRLTGVLALSGEYNRKVATSSEQNPPDGIGIDQFEFWLPQRRPGGQNLAMRVEPPIRSFEPENLIVGPARPTTMPNAWVASPGDDQPELTLAWDQAICIKRMIVELDPDWDHAMESVLMTHPEEVVPFMVKDFDIVDDHSNILVEVRDNHSAHLEFELDDVCETTGVTLVVRATHGAPAAVFRLRVFEV
ncbi:MAG: FAD-dependent oxidoreductase [Verrucomicrobiota bacterium]